MNFWGVATVSVSEGATLSNVGKGRGTQPLQSLSVALWLKFLRGPTFAFCVCLVGPRTLLKAPPGQGAELRASRTSRARWIAKPLSRSMRSPRRAPLETPSSLQVLPDLTTPRGLPPDGPASAESADTALGLSSQQSRTSPGQGAHSSPEKQLQGKKRVVCSRRKPRNADSPKDSRGSRRRRAEGEESPGRRGTERSRARPSALDVSVEPPRRQAACIEKKGAEIPPPQCLLEETRSDEAVDLSEGHRQPEQRRSRGIDGARSSQQASEQSRAGLAGHRQDCRGGVGCRIEDSSRRRNSAFRGHPRLLVARRDLPKPTAPPKAGSSAPALYAGETTSEAGPVVEAPVQYPADVKLGLRRYRDQLERRRAILAKAKAGPCATRTARGANASASDPREKASRQSRRSVKKYAESSTSSFTSSG